MFRRSLCHLQGAYPVTLLNHIYTIAVHVKINKVFKNNKILNLETCRSLTIHVFILFIIICAFVG